MLSRLLVFTIGVTASAGALLYTRSAQAILSSDVTLSGGYYRDYNEQTHTPVFFYWNLNHTAGNGIETFFDVGANNNLVENTWGFYVYQGYFTIPLGHGFEEAPFRRSRIQLGRQLLTEGFELTLLDGIQAPIYWSANGGVNLIAGGNYWLQTKQLDFNSQIYGGTLHQRFTTTEGASALLKAGFFQKHRNADTLGTAEQDQQVVFAQSTLSLDRFPLAPTLLLKGQWTLSPPATSQTSRFEQAHADLQLNPLETVAVGGLYSKRQPSPMDTKDSRLIYRLFSITPVETLAGYVTWSPSRDLRFQATTRNSLFDSTFGKEVGTEHELTISWLHARTSWMPSITYLKSFGGEFVEPALGIRRDLTDNTALKAQVATARIKKINGMTSWAQHLRAGIDHRLGTRLSALILAELERNHVFVLDLRGILFLSYHLF